MNRYQGLTKPSALAAGVLLVLGNIVQLIPVARTESGRAGSPVFLFASIVLLAAALLLLLALSSLYVRRAAQVGSFGFSAVLVAGTGTVLLCSVYWSHAFLWPSLAQAAPELLDESVVPGPFRFGELVARVIFGIGWIMAGVALLRAHIYGYAPAIVMMIGAVVTVVPSFSSVIPSFIVGQLIFGIGVFWLGLTPAYVLTEHYRRHEAVT